MLKRIKAAIGWGLTSAREEYFRLLQEYTNVLRQQNDDIRTALAPYREAGQESIAALTEGGMDFAEAKRELDANLALMKPEAATAPPGG